MRKSGVAPALLVLAALLVASPSVGQEKGKPKAKETTSADVGKRAYEQYCSNCHGPDGKGDGTFSNYLKAPPPDLTTIAKRQGGSFPETEIAEMIDGRKAFPGHGTAEMPIWGKRFGSVVPGTTAKQASIRHEVTVLVAYLRSIQQK